MHHAARFCVREWFQLFQPAAYNALRTVEDADAVARREDVLYKAVQHLAPIFVRNEVTDLCGINLLHNHWQIACNEIPEQVLGPLDDEPALVTRPVERSQNESCPASWMLCTGDSGENAMSVFEYSLDPVANEATIRLSRKQAFFDEVWKKLVELKLDRVFGVCTLPRTPLSDDPTTKFLELTGEDRTSIVVARNFTSRSGYTAIQTCWTFGVVTASDTFETIERYTCAMTHTCESDNVPIGPPYYRTKNHGHIHNINSP